jgi:hypothetical protein
MVRGCRCRTQLVCDGACDELPGPATLVFSVEGRPDDGPGRWPISRVSTVSDHYFETLSIPLVRGRYLDARDPLGAEPRHVIRLVAGQGLALIGAGLLIGVAAALALTRLVASLLYGVSPTDPVTFVAIAALLLSAAAAATYVPAGGRHARTR